MGAFAARVSASLLTAVGHTELIAESPADYVAMAVRLANDRSALQDLRSSLRESMRLSPLLDAVNYNARFYSAMRTCWIDYCRSNSGPV